MLYKLFSVFFHEVFLIVFNQKPNLTCAWFCILHWFPGVKDAWKPLLLFCAIKEMFGSLSPLHFEGLTIELVSN